MQTECHNTSQAAGIK